MTAVFDHYDRLLAPIYLWMAGGSQVALKRGAEDLASLGIGPSSGAIAVDLGAGFGMHAIPLARLGYSVTAIDTSSELLAQIVELGGGLRIRTVQADLLDFSVHVAGPASVILCMGDTLTHLSSPSDVERLCTQVAVGLAAGGRFVTTFRDYTQPPRGEARFILVRSDANRIHTCFLEEQPERMRVHDIVHERQGDGWTMRVSSYPKLRLDPNRVVRALEQSGLKVTRTAGPRGMVQVVAARLAGS